MRGVERRLTGGASAVLVLLVGGCGVTLDLDPRAPAPSSGFDAGRGARDGGRRRDAGDRDAGPGDAGPMVDGFVRECASNADCFDPCLVGRTCRADGLCSPGTPRDCDDGDYCTDDSCGPMGCENVRPAVDPCDDGDACTTQRCTSGPDATAACVLVSVMACDDGVTCTVDSCDPSSGLCASVADDALCPLSALGEAGVCDSTSGCQYPTCSDATCASDGCYDATCAGATCMRTPLCTSGQMCCGGACVPAGCDDGNPCTMDSCATDDCLNVPLADGTACVDADLCSVGGTCHSGACVSLGPRSCDDGNPCTADTCDGLTGMCIRTTSTTDGVSCDDGDACSTDDACLRGVCTGGPSPCPLSRNRCKPNLCTTTGAATYLCEATTAMPGTRCGAQMTCDAEGACVCDAGMVDCDGNGLSCECPATACLGATGTCTAPVDPCTLPLCGAISCCPSTGECYVPRCLACCPP